MDDATRHGIDDALDAALRAGATCVTANNRLAGHLRRAYDLRRQATGEALWRSADLLPWGAWLRRTWEEGWEALAARPGGPAPPLLLSPAQAALVWEEVVAAAPEGPGLLDAGRAAGQAADAWELLHAWRLERDPLRRDPSGSVRAFARWADAFEARCEAEGWWDDARVADRLAGWIGEGVVPAPGRLVVAGFDELTPQQRRLLDALRARGTDVAEWAPPWPPGEAVRTDLPDAEAELAAAARWARHRLEAAGEGPSPALGVVVNDLPAVRERAARIFADVLEPGALVGHGAARRPFNLSLGAPLAEVPVVRDALALLEPVRAPASLERIGAVLASPFLDGGEAERLDRARLDAWLGRGGALQRSWRTVRELAAGDRGEAPRCPRLARALERREAVEARAYHVQGPVAWADAFSRALEAVGWPGHVRDGARGLDSAEQQAVHAWQDVLGDLARLEAVRPRMAPAEALERLRRLAREAPFQPESGPAPVQVLGVLEAGGLRFDGVWLLGFHDETWPRAAAPNPFLPLAAQRRHGLPHASARRELDYARRQTARLLAAAPAVVASHARHAGERVLRCSPLLDSLPYREAGDLPRSEVAAWPDAVHAAAPTPLEALADFRAPPLPAGSPARGGVGLFQDQAACPFRAFARHRLHAEGLEAPEPGLPRTERGALVHKALEVLWARLTTQEALRRLLDEGGAAALIGRTVDEVLADYVRKHPHLEGSRVAEVERLRLERLLEAFLEQERARAAPFVVAARERQHTATFGGVEVTTRIDRIDELADGSQVILDYKTGRVRVGSWTGERPEEPQLPVYAASSDAPLAAVAFAQVSARGVGFAGVARDADVLPVDVVGSGRHFRDFPDVAALVESWRPRLEALGAAFRAGEARVDPRDDQACRLCDLHPLCRIHELEQQWPAARRTALLEGGDGDDER